MSYLAIPAEELRIGDQILMDEKFAKTPSHRYLNIKKVKHLHCPKERENHGKIMVVAQGRSFMLSPDQEVFVQRFDTMEI